MQFAATPGDGPGYDDSLDPINFVPSISAHQGKNEFNACHGEDGHAGTRMPKVSNLVADRSSTMLPTVHQNPAGAHRHYRLLFGSLQSLRHGTVLRFISDTTSGILHSLRWHHVLSIQACRDLEILKNSGAERYPSLGPAVEPARQARVAAPT